MTEYLFQGKEFDGRDCGCGSGCASAPGNVVRIEVDDVEMISGKTEDIIYESDSPPIYVPLAKGSYLKIAPHTKYILRFPRRNPEKAFVIYLAYGDRFIQCDKFGTFVDKYMLDQMAVFAYRY